MDVKLRENKKLIKIKEEEEKLLMDECLCSNAHHYCFFNSIQEEGRTQIKKQSKTKKI